MDYLGRNSITGETYVLPEPLEIQELCASDKIRSAKVEVGVCGATDPLYTFPTVAPPNNAGRYIMTKTKGHILLFNNSNNQFRWDVFNPPDNNKSFAYIYTVTPGSYDLLTFIQTLYADFNAYLTTFSGGFYATKNVVLNYDDLSDRVKVTMLNGGSPPNMTLNLQVIGAAVGWQMLGQTLSSPVIVDGETYILTNPPTTVPIAVDMEWNNYPFSQQNIPNSNGLSYVCNGDLTIAGDGYVTGDLTIKGTVISVDELKVEDPIINLAVNNVLADTFNSGIVTTFNNGTQSYAGIIRQPISGDWYLMNSNAPIIHSTFPTGTGSLIGDKLTANGQLTGNSLLLTGDFYFTNNEHFFIAGNNLSAPSPLIMNSIQTSINLLDGLNTVAMLISATQLNAMIDLQCRGKLFCYDVIDTAGAAQLVIKSQGSNVLYHTSIPIPFLGTGLFLCDEAGGTQFRINSVASTSLNDFHLETGQMNTSSPLVIASQNIKTVSSNGSTNILHDEVGGDCLQVSQTEVSTTNNFRAGGQVQSDTGIFNSPIGVEVQTSSQTVIKADTITTLIQTATNTSNISLITGQVDVSVPLNIFTNTLLGAVSGTVFRSYRPNNGPITGGGTVEMFSSFIATGSIIGSNSIPTVLLRQGSQIKVKCSGIQSGILPGIADELTIFIKLNGTIVGNITKIKLGTIPATELGWTMDWTYILDADPSAATVGYISGEFKSNQNPDYSVPKIGIVVPGSISGIVPPQCPAVDMISTPDVLIEMDFFWASWSVTTYLNFYTSEIQVMT